MTAPVPIITTPHLTATAYRTARTPAGTKMDDGFYTMICIQDSGTDDDDLNIAFWEKTVTPPGIDGEDAIDTSTMLNDAWRTFAARSLQTLTEASATVAWDPVLYDSILALLNEHSTINIIFPNGDVLAFFGYLRVFTPGEHSEGSQPEASITIQPVNQDSSGNEEAPVLYDADA